MGTYRGIYWYSMWPDFRIISTVSFYTFSFVSSSMRASSWSVGQLKLELFPNLKPLKTARQLLLILITQHNYCFPFQSTLSFATPFNQSSIEHAEPANSKLMVTWTINFMKDSRRTKANFVTYFRLHNSLRLRLHFARIILAVLLELLFFIIISAAVLLH